MTSPSRISRHDIVRSTPRWLLVFALVPVLLAGTGTAYAFWSAMGSGAADIKAHTAQPLGVSSLTTPLVDLYPGKTSGLGIVLTNSNPYPVRLTRLTGVSVTSNDEAGCAGGTYITVPPAVSTGLAAGGFLLQTPIDVPAGSSGTAVTVPDLIVMTSAAPDACQGKTFTVTLSFSGSQV